MKRLLIVLLVAVSSLAQSSLAQAPPPALDANAQKAHDLLQQAITALGGDAYLNLETVEQEGRSYSFHNGQPTSLGVLFWRFWKFPDKDRVEVTKQRDIAYIYTGDNAYEVTYRGTALMDAKIAADALRRRNFSLEWVLRRWTKEPGVAFFYDGPAIAEQKMCDQVSLLNTRNQQVTVFLDQRTHLPVKKTYSWRDPADREKDTEDELYDAYRLVQGVMTPHSLTRVYNGETTNQRFITKVTYNSAIADTLFQATATYDPNQYKPRKK